MFSLNNFLSFVSNGKDSFLNPFLSSKDQNPYTTKFYETLRDYKGFHKKRGWILLSLVSF